MENILNYLYLLLVIGVFKLWSNRVLDLETLVKPITDLLIIIMIKN